jgi:hypothetical protein
MNEVHRFSRTDLEIMGLELKMRLEDGSLEPLVLWSTYPTKDGTVPAPSTYTRFFTTLSDTRRACIKRRLASSLPMQELLLLPLLPLWLLLLLLL